MNILVLSAHPDDEVLGVGGTVKKYSKSGHNVKIVFMATGLFGRRSTNYKNSTNYNLEQKESLKIQKQLKKLQNEASNAAKLMGTKTIDFFDFPDNEMDLISNLHITKKIEDIIESFKPRIVFTHSKNDLNVDHRKIFDATITATRTLPESNVKEVLSYEVSSSSEWNFGSSFVPNVFIDISKELNVKLKALSCYKSEIRKFPHPRSLKGIKVTAEKWGSVSGCSAAEAFCLIRQIR